MMTYVASVVKDTFDAREMATITTATTHVGVYSKVGPSSAMSMPLSLPKSNFRQTLWAKKKIKCENLWGLAL